MLKFSSVGLTIPKFSVRKIIMEDNAVENLKINLTANSGTEKPKNYG